MKYYTEALRNYFNFAGRANRAEFWMFMLVYVVVELVLVLLASLVGHNPDGTSNAIGMVLLSLVGLFSLLNLIPSLAVTIRRLHDTGRNAWWYFIGFVPVVGGIWLLILLCQPSEAGANQWGPNRSNAVLATA
jgi:uncharacterized membrane protein YhaH (DUF805 family)